MHQLKDRTVLGLAEAYPVRRVPNTKRFAYFYTIKFQDQFS